MQTTKMMILGREGLTEIKPNAAEVGDVLQYESGPGSMSFLIVTAAGADYCQACERCGGYLHRVDFRTLRHISEKFGIGIYKTDRPKASEEEIEEAKAGNLKFIADGKAAEEKDAKEAAAEKVRLLIKYDFLERAESRGGVAAAKNMRTLFKREFPGIKFSVRSDYSSVNIGWDNGPTVEAVEKITNNFSGGHFNGMEDIYEYSSSVFGNLFGSAQYVFTSRGAKEATDAIKAAIMENQAADNYDSQEYARRKAWEIVGKTDLTNKGAFIRIEYVDKENSCEKIAIFEELPAPAPKKATTPRRSAGSAKTTDTTPRPEPVELEAGQVRIIDYSAKACAIIGDTKPIKDALKERGARFNFRLSCGPGWIIPKKRRADFEEFAA